MSKLIKTLGRATATKSAATRQVIVDFNPKTGAPIEKTARYGQAVGRFMGSVLDDAVRGGAGLIGRGLSQKGVGPKVMTLGGLGLGMGALNEGLGSAGLPHFNVDKSPTWSPEMAPVRSRMSRGLGDTLYNFFTRPVQSTFFGNGPIPDFSQVMSKKMPSWAKMRPNKVNADGTVDMTLSGTGSAALDPTYMDFLRQMQQDNQVMRAQGILPGGGQNQQIQPKNYQFYNDRPGTGFSASSTF